MVRKVLFLFIAFFFSLSSYSQIRKSFWGLTLGVSTKQQVYNTMTKKGYKLTWSIERNTYETEKVTFAGHFWPFFAFQFYNGKLMCIAFMDATLSTPSETLDIVYETIKTRLKTKYKGKEKPYDKDTYSDGVTCVDIMRYYTGGEKFISLGYTDEELSNKESIRNTDDL